MIETPRTLDTTRHAVGVGIVEDQPEIREGLTRLVGSAEGFRLVGAWGSMEDALPGLGRDVPDVALVDIGLPGMSGIEGIRILRERHSDLAALVLTVYDDDDRIFEALCAGACGYLLKTTPAAELLRGLEQAAEGGAPVSPEIARRVIGLFRRFRPSRSSGYDLTPHETRLLGLLVDGHNYRSAAAALGCSVHTVNFHMKSVYRKLEVHSKSEAVAKALRERVVD
jgi:DNA-binding NarL/FixJ family response regulator